MGSRIFTPLGASNHTRQEREKNDFYATSPEAVTRLIGAGTELPRIIYEPACGTGCLSEALKGLGHEVHSCDIVDRGYGRGGVDFLATDRLPDGCRCILTNPPYSLATEFVLHALDLLDEGGAVRHVPGDRLLGGEEKA